MYTSKTTGGFSLIEVMVSVVILAISLLFGLSFFSFGHKDTAAGKHTTYALQLAKDHLEYMRSLDYTGIPVSSNTTHSSYGVTFSRQFSSRVKIGTENDEYRVLSVTVTWTANGSITKSVSLNTLKAKF